MTITDFGNPIIIGRGYNVLSTEIYLQVIGMQRFDLGTTIAVVLLVPSVIAFLFNYYFTKKSHAMISGQAKPQLPPSSRAKRTGFATYSWIIAGIMLSVIAVIIVKSFIKVWMYNWGFTTGHYQFKIPGGTGVLWMSLWISIFVGFFGALLTLLNGYIIEKKKLFFAQPLYLFSVIPAAMATLIILVVMVMLGVFALLFKQRKLKITTEITPEISAGTE